MSTSSLTAPAVVAIPAQRRAPAEPQPDQALRRHTGTLTLEHVHFLRAMHRGMLRDLDRIADWAAGAAGGDEDTLARRPAFAAYARRVLLLVEQHHENEDDLVFPVVSGAVAHIPPAIAALAALGDDHREIDVLLYRVLRTVELLGERAPDPAGLRVFAADSARLARLLHEHVADEERIVFPVLLRCVSAEMWAAVAAAAASRRSLADAAFVAPWFASAAKPYELELVLRTAPRVMRLALRVSRRRYARQVAAAFG